MSSFPINSNVIDPGWWSNPQIWMVVGVVLIVILLIGIAVKALGEHQGFDINM